MSSGFMKPLDTIVGVHRTSRVVEADGDVAVVGGGEALGVNAAADFADLFFQSCIRS